MRHLRYDIQFFDRQLIDFVENVDAGDVPTIAFYHIYQLVDGCVAATEDIRRHNAIFFAYRVNDRSSEVCLRHHRLEIDGTLLFAPANHDP